jgi:hypothetical protein
MTQDEHTRWKHSVLSLLVIIWTILVLLFLRGFSSFSLSNPLWLFTSCLSLGTNYISRNVHFLVHSITRNPIIFLLKLNIWWHRTRDDSSSPSFWRPRCRLYWTWLDVMSFHALWNESLRFGKSIRYFRIGTGTIINMWNKFKKTFKFWSLQSSKF